MRKPINFILKRGLFLSLFLSCSISLFAIDDVIQIKNITAGDTYNYSTVSPQNLISTEGLTPSLPTDVANATYQMVGSNCWHTSGGTNSQAWLLVELQKSIPVSKMYIWNLNQNGHKDRDIKNVTIAYSSDSNDGVNGTWLQLGDFVIPQSAGDAVACKSQIAVDFNVSVRFVKIQATSSYGSNYWGLGKIIMLQDNSQGNGEYVLALKEQQIAAKSCKFYNYTDGTWYPLALAMNVAQLLIDNESQDITELTAATQALKDALAGLVAKTNLVTGATGTSAVFYGSGYEPKNAVDGQFNTRWASTSGTSFSYQIDLGSAKTFNQAMIFETQQYAGRIANASISVSNDGNTWTLWRNKGCRDYYTSAVGESVNMRYVKVDFHECNPDGINIDEIMLFNDASAIESIDPTAPRPQDPTWVTQESSTSPNVYQIRKANLKYGMFIHYGINTFIGQEWTDGNYPASTYHPNLATLDPESWVKAAYEGGMNFVVLITKHHDGFALWNTAVGTYNINNTGREGDKRDIVKEVSDACKKYGIKLGLYYSAWDRNWDLNHTIKSTGLDRVALNQLYNDFALAQVTELMDGRYGEISEFWIDGPWVKSNNDWEFPRLYNTVKTLQPTCQFGVNCTIKDLLPNQTQGGEEIRFFPSDFRLQDPLFTRVGANADPKVYSHEGKDYYLPFEATICMNNSWFWTAGQNAAGVKPAADIQKSYNHMSEQENTLVINLSPSTDGVLNSFDVSGLYAGARALGIARGAARSTIQPDECAVEVRCVTDKGYIAYPTKFIYGKEGDAYTILPQNLELLGYKLVLSPNNATGTFGKDKMVVEFTYEDTKMSIPTAIRNTVGNGQNRAFFNGREIVLVCNEPSDVEIFNVAGVKVKGLHITMKSTKKIDASNFEGFYLIKFTGENKNIYTEKIQVI